MSPVELWFCMSLYGNQPDGIDQITLWICVPPALPFHESYR